MLCYDLNNLVQRFNGRDVLAIERLQIESGKIYGLLGPNGAGKTTLFNILAFLEAPFSGEVVFQGRPVSFTAGKLHHYRRRVVMVDQYPIMFSTTVAKNIEFGLKVRGVDKVDRARIVDEVLEKVDLSGYRNEHAKSLSGGETQRLALARALALSPEVLLCDEPTANVDVENRAVILGLLSMINHEHDCTVIFTTHDRLQAAGLAEETLVLEKGRLASTSYENIFSCSLRERNGDAVCMLQGKTPLKLPANVTRQKNGNRVYLDPLLGTLAPCEDSTPTSDACLQGEVAHIIAEGKQVRITVNTGVLVAVLVEKEVYRQQRFAVGDAVMLRFDASGIRLF